MDRARCRGAGLAETRRDHCGGHGREYRDRARACGQCAGLQDHYRDARDAIAREDGYAAGVARGTGAGAGGAVFEPVPLRPHLAPAGRGDAGCGVGQPVRQCRQSPRAYRKHRGRDLGADGRTDRRVHLRGGNRRDDRGGGPRAQGVRRQGHDRADRSARRCALQLLRAWRVEGRGVVGGRGDRAGADHRQPRGRADRHPVPHFGRGRAALGRTAAGR